MATYNFDRYPNIRRAHSPSFGPEGGQLSFLMNTTGVPQVWRLDEPGQWPQQLTFEEERVNFVSWSPAGEELIFGMDRGGDEHTQLFRLDDDGESVVPLTDTPEAIHIWGGWNSDGTEFAYTANRRNESVFDVYVQARNEPGHEADLIYESSGNLSVEGWSPNDDCLAVLEAHSSFDHDVYILDFNSGNLEHVTPHKAEVRYSDINWGPDGDALYFATDDSADTKYLARLDLESGRVETVIEGGEWNVEFFHLDEDTGRFIVGRNVEGFTELTTGELAGATTFHEFPTPDLPDGVYKCPSFDGDAEQVALTGTGSAENENVYVVDVATGAAQRWTDAATAGLPKESFVEPDLVHYRSFDGLEIPAFFSIPKDAKERATPVIVNIHGGPEGQHRPSFSAVKQYFINRGYAVFEPNIRGSTGYGKAYTHLDDVEKRMDSVADIKAGVEWLYNQRPVDSDRIVAFGGSYGGFMVLAALTEYPALWAAGVDLMGIANLVTFLENTGEWRREHREAEYGSLEEDREFLESISPTNNIENIEAPLLVLHGANDPRVPVDEAEQIVEIAATQGVPVEKHIFEDEGHGFTKTENRLKAYTMVTEFLDEYV